jgi:transposase
MLKVSDSLEIYVCLQPMDMRKSFDSLSAIVSTIICKDPLSGHLFVFINKNRSKIKILFWDRTGYCQYYKRLESGRITLPRQQGENENSIQISTEQLRLILDGIDLWGIRAG